MIRSNSKNYSEIREYLDTVPVIETHQHYTGITGPIENVFDLLGLYRYADFVSAAFGTEKKAEAAFFSDETLSFDEKYNRFEHTFKKSDKTAYARAFKAALKECWGIDEISKKSLLELSEKLKSRNQDFYEDQMNRFGIKAKIVNVLFPDGILNSFKMLVDGRNKDYTKYCRFAFPINDLHCFQTIQDIFRLEEYLERKITCLDDYLQAFDNFFEKSVSFGIVCMKDQSAYRRKLDFGNPTRAEAETQFNKILNHPKDTFGIDETKALDDWMFHYFIRIAQKHDLPVQIHTGHIHGVYGDDTRANATHLLPLLNIHPDVRFDLFHGNWPYMDEMLFIAKSYPNAYLDLCWVHSIDPLYSIELMKRAILAVPHSKIMAFGGDTTAIELTIGYLLLARDNIAYALSDMVDCGWIDKKEAMQIAADWLFNNPNDFFKLGFERFDP